MRLAIGVMGIVAAVSGCSSTGLPALGSVRSYAYPSERSATPVFRAVLPAQDDVLAQPLAPTPAAVASSPFQGPVAGPVADELPAYDETKDPYVTAVLLPPVDTADFDGEIGPDGRRVALATPMKIEVIDLRDNLKVLAAANP